MTLTNPSRLIDKYADELGPRLLMLNPMADGLIPRLQRQGMTVTTLTHDYLVYRQLRGQGATDLHFGCDLTTDLPEVDAAIMVLPGAKALASHLMQWLAARLPEGTPCFLVGDNKGGIRSAPKLMKAHFDPVNKYATGAHCQMLQGLSRQADRPPLAATESYRAGEPPVSVCALPGVFSQGELDAGTALLLEHLPPLKGRVLDFGCGAGVIGSAIKAAAPDCQVEMVDINAFALACSRATLAANGLDARVYPSDGFSDVKGEFDLIISNPPFHHAGKQTFSTAEAFIADARKHLKPGGQLLFVANHHLPYGDALEKAFGRVNIAAQDKRFKIYADLRVSD
ncbi:class I SAM-dependent methyltransferase [Ferrimonas sediminicola]|uniref:Ribosomal RNA small subunit methyltransferase C n=1 Tax=Ferrimonas sediminicola TaxID=2569538 RepID=A0A4U1BCC2_9GAMM|nr:class I SAM-dependent methyltransferase [Ferrimonas sediminicola]TKB48627.1 class I SAM-dependent methyltransferase [Ferrimonas sediminicola]